MKPTRRGLTVAFIVALAAAWPFLPEFTTVVVSYIGLYAIVAAGLVISQTPAAGSAQLPAPLRDTRVPA